MWGFFLLRAFFFLGLRLSKILGGKQMIDFNSESKDFFVDQEVKIKKENKPDLIFKMNLAELILHATILILLV